MSTHTEPQLVKLSVGLTNQRGRGVFATSDFVDGDLIESCPVIAIPGDQRSILDRTVLHNYYFSWGPESADAAICLGFGSIYNHSFKPNAQYVNDHDHSVINFFAIRPISAGEEITVNYHGDPDSLEPLWFEAVPK